MNETLGARYDNCDDPTEEQLIAFYNNPRVIRSHRAPKTRHPRLVAATLTTALALGVISSSTAGPMRAGEPDATNAVLATSPVSPLPVTTLDEQRRLREDRTRVSRDENRTIVPHLGATMQRVKLLPHWVSPIVKQRITSCYGLRHSRMHKGIDFAASTGTKIRAVGSGTVVQAGWRYSGLGYSVVIKHGNGQMSLYGHASKVVVRTGQKVQAGATVALVGSTGHSTGPHLHFGYARTNDISMIFSRLLDPAPWLKSNGVQLVRC